MTFRHRLAGAATIAACASALVLPASAGANFPPRNPPPSFQETYAAATGLCSRVSRGVENKVLKLHAASVLADCTLLQSAYTSATTTVVAARAPLLPQIAAVEHAVATACPAHADHTAACERVRATDAPTLRALRDQMEAIGATYHAAITAGRIQFWRAVEALPGGAHIPGELHPPF